VLELRRRAIRGGRIDTELTRCALIAEVPEPVRDQERDESLSDIHRESISEQSAGTDSIDAATLTIRHVASLLGRAP
jgi:hypothetical protein